MTYEFFEFKPFDWWILVGTMIVGVAYALMLRREYRRIK